MARPTAVRDRLAALDGEGSYLRHDEERQQQHDSRFVDALLQAGADQASEYSINTLRVLFLDGPLSDVDVQWLALIPWHMVISFVDGNSLRAALQQRGQLLVQPMAEVCVRKGFPSVDELQKVAAGRQCLWLSIVDGDNALKSLGEYRKVRPFPLHMIPSR